MGMHAEGHARAQWTGARMRAACAWLPAVAAVGIACVVGGIVFSPARGDAATFRVIDGATGDPLEGAAVVVVWHRAVFHGVAPYHVAERVTGVDGTFAAPVFPGLPLLQARRDVLLFKPGYRPRVEHTRDRTAPLLRQTEIALTKVTSLEEARAQARAGDLGMGLCVGAWHAGCVRPEQVPHLMRLMAIQQKVYNPPPAGISPSGQRGR
jgi:hypothetical protein